MEQKVQDFCKIPFPENSLKLTVFLTNNHIIDNLILTNEKYIDIYYDKLIKLDLNGRFKYTDEEYDITIIKIKEEKDNIKTLLEIDNNIMEEGTNKLYLRESIYVLQYPEEEKLVSYGILKDVVEDKKYNFTNLCCTFKGSSGSPIIHL